MDGVRADGGVKWPHVARPATGTQAHVPGREGGRCASALHGATPVTDRAGYGKGCVEKHRQEE